MLIVRGVCLVASTPVDLPNLPCPLRFRQRSLVAARVPLYLDDGHGKISTSFECSLVPQGLYCAFSCEMPDDDEEAEMVAEHIISGFDGVELGVDLLRRYSRWEERGPLFVDVVEYNPLSITLKKWAPAAAHFSSVEDNGEITYDLPSEIEPLFFAVHEDIADEPLYFDDDGEQVEIENYGPNDAPLLLLPPEDHHDQDDDPGVDQRLRALWESDI